MIKKSIALVVSSLFASTAFACGQPGQPDCAPLAIPVGQVNQGVICDKVTTTATVVGQGTSYSFARAATEATANGSLVTNVTGSSATGTVTGNTAAYSNGVAYNVSTGTGTGTAMSQGNAFASLTENAGNVGYNANGATGKLTLQGSSTSAANHLVSAGTNRGGSAASEATGSFNVTGAVSYNPTTHAVAGTVSDVKTSTAGTSTGLVLNGTTPMAPAVTNGGAQSNVEVYGYFIDPTK